MVISPILWAMAAGLLQAQIDRSGPAISSNLFTPTALASGSVVFAAGWITVGAGLRPFQRAWLGALVAGVLYVSIGLVWLYQYLIIIRRMPLSRLTEPTTLLIPITWPQQMAAAIDLFGLGK